MGARLVVRYSSCVSEFTATTTRGSRRAGMKIVSPGAIDRDHEVPLPVRTPAGLPRTASTTLPPPG